MSEIEKARARVNLFRGYYERWALATGNKSFYDLTIFEAELAAGMFAQGLRHAADIAWNAGTPTVYTKIMESVDGTD